MNTSIISNSYYVFDENIRPLVLVLFITFGIQLSAAFDILYLVRKHKKTSKIFLLREVLNATCGIVRLYSKIPFDLN